MKKLIYVFLALLIVACSDDEGNPCVYNLTTSVVTNITDVTANLNGTIGLASEACESANNIQQGFVYATTIQPTISNFKVNVNGTDINYTLENLEPNTTYYARSFLTNALGEFYGNEVSFLTEVTEVPPCLYSPTLTTFVGNITGTTVGFGGSISIVSENCEDPSNTEQGFVFSLETQPTISDNKILVTGVNISAYIENLEYGTTYYVRSFLNNDFGEFYGNEVSFTTEIVPAYVGEFRDGGVVFYVDSSGLHGLVCALTDQGTGIQWYNGDNIFIGEGGSCGFEFTNLIIAVQGEGSYAASIARDYNGGGYTDWYLPCGQSLSQMYYHRDVVNPALIANGGTVYSTSDWYWSSTENTISTAAQVDLSNGNYTGNTPKSEGNVVRAVRAF
tara:strand:+ start:290 stop:1459 length:1170 start_codon:yes stop_codon:yes gene_type:complete